MKIFILSLALFLTISKTYTQQPSTTYRWQDPAGMTSWTLRFTEKQFVSTNQGDMGVVKIDKGYYLHSKDTLVLCYDNPKEDRIKVLSKTKNKTKKCNTVIEFEIKNAKGDHILCNVICKNATGKVVKGFSTNTEGKGILSISNTEDITSIFVTTPADQLELLVQDFLQHTTSLQIRLDDNNYRYNHFTGILKYLVKEENEKTLLLQTMDNQNLILLHRLD